MNMFKTLALAAVLIAFGLYIVIGLKLGATPNPGRFSVQSFLQQAALIHAWAPLPPAEGWNLPTWSLSADKVVQDKQKQLVYYEKAVIRLWGAPLMYLPVKFIRYGT